MKKVAKSPNEPLRANEYPEDGFSMVVDGQFKSHHTTHEAALKVAQDLKTKFPVLQVMVRDNATSVRTALE